MSNEGIVPRHAQYFVTQVGHEALYLSPLCSCKVELDGGLFVCKGCGTVWAKVSTVTAVLRSGGTMIDRP